MDNLNLNKHISGQFNAELEYIRTQVTVSYTHLTLPTN